MNQRDRLLHKAHVAQILFRDQRMANALSKCKSPGRQLMLDQACDRADDAMDALEQYVVDLKLRHYDLLLRFYALSASPERTQDRLVALIEHADVVMAEIAHVEYKRGEFVVECIGEASVH